MDKPLVSVFMPAYNQREFVEEALKSAIEQDYPNLQVVAGDDGSTDGTADIIMDYARRYPDLVTAIVHEPHLGITPNCNRVLKKCNGKYIAFHAGDDLFLPGKISKQVAWLEADDRRVLCGHDVDVFDSATGKTLYVQRSHIRHGRGASAFVRHGAIIYAQGIMLRSNTIPANGFDESLPIASDVRLWIDALAAKNGEFGCIEGVYSRYRRHSCNITDVRVDHVLDHIRSLDMIRADHPQLAADCRYRKAYLQFCVGRWYLSKSEMKAARTYFAHALRQSVWLSWRPQLFWALTFMPASVLTELRSLKRVARGASSR